MDRSRIVPSTRRRTVSIAWTASPSRSMRPPSPYCHMWSRTRRVIPVWTTRSSRASPSAGAPASSGGAATWRSTSTSTATAARSTKTTRATSTTTARPATSSTTPMESSSARPSIPTRTRRFNSRAQLRALCRQIFQQLRQRNGRDAVELVHLDAELTVRVDRDLADVLGKEVGDVRPLQKRRRRENGEVASDSRHGLPLLIDIPDARRPRENPLISPDANGGTVVPREQEGSPNAPLPRSVQHDERKAALLRS